MDPEPSRTQAEQLLRLVGTGVGQGALRAWRTTSAPKPSKEVRKLKRKEAKLKQEMKCLGGSMKYFFSRRKGEELEPNWCLGARIWVGFSVRQQTGCFIKEKKIYIGEVYGVFWISGVTGFKILGTRASLAVWFKFKNM